MNATIFPVSPFIAAVTPKEPEAMASFWSALESIALEQRWDTFNSTERTLTPRRSLTRFSRYFPEPVSIL